MFQSLGTISIKNKPLFVIHLKECKKEYTIAETQYVRIFAFAYIATIRIVKNKTSNQLNDIINDRG